MKSAVIPVIMIREEPEQIKRCVRCWFVRFSDEAYINCSRTPPRTLESRFLKCMDTVQAPRHTQTIP